MVLPRRVVVGDVERAEIVPVALDVRPFGDLEAHGAEQGREFLHRPRDGVDAALGGGAGGGSARGQRHVDALGREARIERGGIEHHAARLDGRLDGRLQPVQRGAAFLPLVGRHGAEALEQRGQAAGLAHHPHAHGIERTEIGSGRECGLGLGLQGSEVVGHWHHVRKTRRAAPRSARDAALC